MRLSHLIGATTAVLLASFASANAQQSYNVGVLRCHGGQNVGQVVTSTTELECVFEAAGRRPDAYVATIKRFGIELGVTQQTDLRWRVSAPVASVAPGALTGNYGGVGGNVSVGIGGGSNLLVGGTSGSFALQPISLQGQTGLNVSGGVVGLELEPVVYRHHRRHHRHH